MKIRTKFFLSFFLIAGLSAFFATFFSIYSTNARYAGTAVRAIETAKKTAENTFSEYLGELIRKATFLAELNEVIANIDRPDELSSSLESKAFFLSNLNTWVLDRNHRMIVTWNNATQSLIDQPSIARLPALVRADEFLRSAWILKMGTGIGIYAFSPIIDAERFERKGALLIELPLDSLFADSIKEKTKTEILIFSGKAPLASTFVDANGSRYFPELRRLTKGQQSQVEVMGATYLFDRFPIRDSEQREIGTLFVGVDIQELIVAKRIGIYSMVLVFLLLVVLGILGSVVVGNRMANPLRVLSEGADRVARGDFDVHVPISRKDEIGNLARVFNHMAASLKGQTEEMSHIRQYLQNIIDSMPSALIGVDAEERITQWNLEAERMIGVKRDRAQGQLLREVFPPLENQLVKIRQAMKERKPLKTERMSLFAQGSQQFLDLMIYPLVSNGLDGAVVRIDNITTRVRIEEMMVQTEKMMSVGGLAAGMAHEINNPLGGIIQGSQNILRRISGELPKNRQVAEECGTDLDKITRYLEKREIVDFLRGIRECGERAAVIVENMLSFSRRSESKMAPVDLAKLLDRSVQLAASDYDLKKRYDFRHIQIQRQFADDFPQVPCVVSEIQQVVLNLLKNAAQAMFEKKRADGDPPRIVLRLYREGDLARIEIEDNGPGMDETTRKRIFEPFFTTKEAGIGTGLGLFVSFFIITNNHRGTLEVESTPGQGTRFLIGIPLVRS